MQSLGIILVCIVAAVIYGILHDMVTTRVCVEYFTIGHPPVFDTEDPTLLALGWGVFATWWVGLLLGIGLALVARAGRMPKRSLASLIRPICWLLVIMAVSATLAGFAGYLLAKNGVIQFIGPMSARIPPDLHPYFLADLWAHSMSYAAGFLGGMIILLLVLRSRWKAGAPGRGSPALKAGRAG